MMPATLPPSWLARMHKPTAPVVASRPCTVPITARGTAYGRAAVEAELERVSTWPNGDRNNQVNRSALALGTLYAGGEIGDVREDLVRAAMSNPNGPAITAHEARATVVSGWRKGLETPRKAPPRGKAYV